MIEYKFINVIVASILHNCKSNDHSLIFYNIWDFLQVFPQNHNLSTSYPQQPNPTKQPNHLHFIQSLKTYPQVVIHTTTKHNFNQQLKKPIIYSFAIQTKI